MRIEREGGRRVERVTCAIEKRCSNSFLKLKASSLTNRHLLRSHRESEGLGENGGSVSVERNFLNDDDELSENVKVRTSLVGSQLPLLLHPRFGPQTRPHRLSLVVVSLSLFHFSNLKLYSYSLGFRLIEASLFSFESRAAWLCRKLK